VRKLSMFLGAIFWVVFFSGYASAVPIRYDVVGGVDNYGNDFSGYVDIEDEVIILAEDGIAYDIAEFKFTSEAGVFIGHSGRLTLLAGPELEFISTSVGTASFSDGDTGWNNNMCGVWFDVPFEQSPLEWPGFVPIEQYMTLPQDIAIYWPNLWPQEWGPLGMLYLSRSAQPVHEPATMLLVSSGLLSLAVFRGKIRKK